MQLTADMIDDALAASSTRMLYRPQTGQVPLAPQLAFLEAINAKLADMGGNAGTHVYEMMASVAAEDAAITESLIQLVAASCLMQLGHQSVTISPLDLDFVHQHYDITANRDGLQTTVTIAPRG